MKEGDVATLKDSYKGYTRIVLLERSGLKWRVEIIGCGHIIEVYEDEFDVD
jgi:hypothetical protein